MTQKFLYVLTMFVTILLVLFLNGNIHFGKDPLPPLGKFLNPFNGIWTSDTRSEIKDITIEANGLKDKVQIIYDDRRVAHIYAQNLEDALFAQGYAEAQNRLFQMEFLAMAAAGELSSIIGPKTIEIDLERRRRGMKYAAENAVKGWEKSDRFASSFRYVDGVNAYINSLSQADLPMEYKLFDFKPSTWTALKSALVFKQMSLVLAGRNDDIENTNLLYYLGKEDFNHLYPEHQKIENPVIPQGTNFQFDSLRGKPLDTLSLYRKPISNKYNENRNKGIGSNSWGISGSKSSTGKPIYCNDPHLSLGLPSVWFEVHIHTPQFNAYGVSFPGFPGIMIGFNEHIAWGETNVGQDVEDVFAVEWTNPEKTKYMLDGTEKEVKYRIEEVKVKGGTSIIDTVKYTHWGPIFKATTDTKTDLALRWICHDEPDTDEFNVFIDAMACKNYDEYQKATNKYISPAQNFGFAAKDGDIAMRVNGRFPAKYDQDGRFVENGNKSVNGWSDWIPKNQNPQIINPSRGFIASANQVSADKTYPYYFTGKFERYRNRSINDKLTNMNAISPEQMQAMQQDAFSYKASDYINVIKSMVKKEDLPAGHGTIFDQLTSWDYQYKANAEMPVLFDLLYKKLVENTWDEIQVLKQNNDVNYPEAWRLLELIQSEPENKFFDNKTTGNKENAKDIVIKSVKESIDAFIKRKNEGESNKWGEYKPLHIYHLTRLPAFSEMDIAADGCPDAINATGFSFGPSWRMVISLEDKVKGHAVYPGGQSGNPASKFYKNMIDAWRKGEYYSLNLYAKPEDLSKNKTQSVILNPNK